MSRFPPGRGEIRRDLVILATGSAILFFLFLGARDLWNPNEPIYGEAVAEMAARGDWLVPTVNGMVFAEKPILYYWMAGIAARLLGGVNEFTLRVPSASSGVLGVVLLYLLVYPYAGRMRARLAAVLFATTYLVYWGARSVQMDILVAVATLAVVLAVSRVVDHGLSPLAGWLLAGLAAGLGFLAKGPVAWICPGLVLLLYLLGTRRPSALASPAVAVGAALCLAVSAPWFIVLLLRGESGAVHELLLRQNVTRFVNPWDHQASWWYYLMYFWTEMAPWAWFVPLAVRLPERDDEERRLDLLAWAWIAGVILFFSLSRSKRGPYILPVAPAVAILVSGLAARLMEDRLQGTRARVCRALQGVTGALAIAAGLFLQVRILPSYPDLSAEGKSLAVLLVVGGAAILGALLGRYRPWVPATAFFSLVLCVYLIASVSVLPAVDAYKSARPFCDRVNAVVERNGELAAFQFWDWRASYTYYMHRPIRNLKTLEALREYWASPRRVFLIVESPRLAQAREVLGEREPLVRAGVGGSIAYLFSNR